MTFPFEAAKYFVRTLDFVAPTAQRLDRSPFGTAVTTSNLTVPTGGVFVSAQVSVPTSGPVTIIYTFPNKDYVSGSIMVPPGFSLYFSSNGGLKYSASEPLNGVTNIQATGTLPSSPGAILALPAPTVGAVSSAGSGGDGLEPILIGTRVFNVYHNTNSPLICTEMKMALPALATAIHRNWVIQCSSMGLLQ